MGEFLDQIPENIQGHIKEITKTSGLPDEEASVEKIAQAWLEKKKAFEDQVQNVNMIEVETLAKDDAKGFLAMTNSGSLVNAGPLVDGVRKAEYSSIGIRADVPPTAEKEGVTLTKDVSAGDTIEFENGPVKSTSAIFKIAVCEEGLGAEEQTEKISQATQILQDEFTKVNKTIISE